MVKIYSSQNGAEVHNLKNVLETRGIECEVRGEHLGAGLGELPANQCWVELWVVNDSMVEEAKRIIRLAASATKGPWTCPKCGEPVEANFDQCWNCQGYRPS